MLALTLLLNASAGERIQYRPLAGDLIIDGREYVGTKKEKAEMIREILDSCPESASLDKKRRTTLGIGQGLSGGGLLAMTIVTATNPYAVGPALAFASLSLSGSGMALMNLTPRKSIDAYEKYCMGEPNLDPDAEEPDEWFDEEPPLD